MVSPLDRKLLRDLWRMKGQAIAIGLVMALGVLMLVMMDGLVNSLDETKRAYYERYRLAGVFAPAKRAPKHLLRDIADIPGVSAVEGRIRGGALIDLPGVAVPIRAQAVSLPTVGTPRLNDIHLTDGRRLDPNHGDEILLLKGFATAHRLRPGSRLTATVNGARRTFRIVGLVQSPEFLYSVSPGEFAPNDARFAVIWMNETALAAAFDLKGAFNEAILSLSRDASLPLVLDRVDQLLARFGGTGAFGLKDQLSNRFIVEEIDGLRGTSATVPPVFLAVAAFLLYIVISRMVQSEREEIGLMKAFGYTSLEVAGHYLKLILIISGGGALLGCILGVIAGRSLVVFYQQYFKFPFLVFEVDPGTFLVGFFASVLAAAAGGLIVLRGVFGLTPAVAMRPPAPADYSRAAGLGRMLKAILDQPSRMVIRRLVRQPWRSSAASVGIGAGMALSVAMLTIISSFDRTLDLAFNVIDRSDVAVTFVEPVGDKTIYALKRMPGVIEVEPFRAIPALLRNRLHTYRGGINGLVATPRLYRAVDRRMKAIFIRRDGIILSTSLAKILKIRAGEILTVEVREGRRPTLRIPVVGISESLLGSPAYLELSAMNRALNEPGRVSGAYLRVDSGRSAEIYKKIKNMPIVAGVSLRAETRAAFKEVMDSGAGSVRYIMAIIAAIITFGIVYNSARIAFAERARDLASLRVIGFTRAETSFVLLGELSVITLAALPVGSVLGYYLSLLVGEGFSTDIYQIPAVFSPESHGLAAVAVLLAAALSGWLVKRDIDKLDLVAVLKTRE